MMQSPVPMPLFRVSSHAPVRGHPEQEKGGSYAWMFQVMPPRGGIYEQHQVRASAERFKSCPREGASAPQRRLAAGATFQVMPP